MRIWIGNGEGGRTVTHVDAEDFGRVLLFCSAWHLHRKRNGRPVAITTTHRISSRPVRKVRTTRLHRFVLELKPGDPMVDHRDGDVCNNRKSNLRYVTNAQNSQNRYQSRRAGSTSQYRGVSCKGGQPRGKPWRGVCVHEGRHYSAGYFATELECAIAVRDLRNRLYTHNDSDRGGLYEYSRSSL